MPPFLRSVALLSFAAASTLTDAASQRTFVASTGVDSNACTLALPCRTFARAITQTRAGGEVIVVDSAGYGTVTISQSVSLIAPSGVFAGITAPAGTNGVTIDAPLDTVIVLRGLSISGESGSFSGVDIKAALVWIDSCVISNFGGDGVHSVNGSLQMKDTVLRDNFGAGVYLNVDDSSHPAKATIDNSVIAGSTTGVLAATSGVSATLNVTVKRSTLTMNVTGLSVSDAIFGQTLLVADGNSITSSINAFEMTATSGVASILTRGNNTIADNANIGSVPPPCCGI